MALFIVYLLDMDAIPFPGTRTLVSGAALTEYHSPRGLDSGGVLPHSPGDCKSQTRPSRDRFSLRAVKHGLPASLLASGFGL